MLSFEIGSPYFRAREILILILSTLRCFRSIFPCQELRVSFKHATMLLENESVFRILHEIKLVSDILIRFDLLSVSKIVLNFIEN